MSGIDGLRVLGQFTNMVFIDVAADRLRAAGVQVSIGYLPTVRLVTHLDVDDAAIARVIEVFRAFAEGGKPSG